MVTAMSSLAAVVRLGTAHSLDSKQSRYALPDLTKAAFETRCVVLGGWCKGIYLGERVSGTFRSQESLPLASLGSLGRVAIRGS